MFIQSSSDERLWENSKILLQQLFKASLLSYVIFYIIDHIRSGFISNFFDIDIVLWTSVVSGALLIIFDKSFLNDASPIKTIRPYYSVAISIIVGLAIFAQIREYGTYALLISIVSGTLIFIVMRTEVDN